jgi:hypothetical protein
MVTKIVLTFLFSMLYMKLNAQAFKEFIPKKEPFKSFITPKFESENQNFYANKNYFLKTE